MPNRLQVVSSFGAEIKIYVLLNLVHYTRKYVLNKRTTRVSEYHCRKNSIARTFKPCRLPREQNGKFYAVSWGVK